ncbi:low molecular weight protein arginine phosphatase [Gracilibacillus sp. S3-1-1]|uniref:Low molecular weight protein arginine phosphatase n=1 Tax=Gracilibacillus pellucidus TaxID=3095368 RepID=A0ACC6MA22_9BACI|nr:low molecular weight protein arginine phosphatase [Gracilibacillus sp. S3-1-1]MDX8047726.1 low molecular weight protein arginine phosphatase [Gracilibacillus sp. S3-1-1]
MNILFVCTGNTCRSPMAEAIMKHKTTHNVQSAGIFAGIGMIASEGTREVLRQEGIDVDHASQPVTVELMSWADLILTMTAQHRDFLKQSYPDDIAKIFTLKEFANPEYEQAWQELKAAYSELEQAKLRGDKQVTLIEDKIRHLEQTIQHVDISDPFGGNYMTYQKTYEEIENYLALLIEKVENRLR